MSTTEVVTERSTVIVRHRGIADCEFVFVMDEADFDVLREIYSTEEIYRDLMSSTGLTKRGRRVYELSLHGSLPSGIGKLDCLESLTIFPSHVPIDFANPPQCIYDLAKLPKLKRLHVECRNIQMWMHGGLEFPKTVTDLCLLTGDILSPVTLPPNLRKLTLRDLRVTVQLQLPAGLDTLCVEGSQLQDLLPHPTLTSFEFYESRCVRTHPIPVVGQDFIDALRSLEKLKVESTSLQRFSSSFPSLTTLELNWKGGGIPEDFLTWFPNLTSLTLLCNSWETQDEHPSRFPHNRVLNDRIENLKLGGDGIELVMGDLTGFSKLSQLCLSGSCKVVEITSAPASFPHLNTLDLEFCSLASFINVKKSQLHAPKLQHFRLELDFDYDYDEDNPDHDNFLSTAWSKTVPPALEMIRHCAQLRTLTFEAILGSTYVDIKMDDSSFDSIVQFFEEHKNVSVLTLDCDTEHSNGWMKRKILEERISIIERLLARNRVNLGLEMAKSRVLNTQLVESSMLPHILSNAEKAFAADKVDLDWTHADAMFHLLRETACKEKLDSRRSS